jgi:hypothetical protein
LSQSKKGILEIQRTTETRNPGNTRPEEIRIRKAEKGFYYLDIGSRELRFEMSEGNSG